MKNLSSIRNWEITRDVAALVGALTSITVIWAIVFNNVMDIFHNPIVSGIFAIAAIAGVLFVVDWGLRADLSYAFDLLLSGKFWQNWRLTVFLVLLMGFNVVRSGVTITLSWQGRKDVVTAITENPELENVAAAKAQLDAASARKIASLEANIKELQSSIKAAEAGAGNAALRTLAASGNGWAKNELARYKARASATYRKQLTTAQATYTEVLQADTRTAAVAVEALAKSNDEKLSIYHEITTRNMAYLGYFGAGCTGVVILISLMLSLVNVAEQETPQYNKRTKVNDVAPNVAPAAATEYDVARNLQLINAALNEMRNIVPQRATDSNVAGANSVATRVQQPEVVTVDTTDKKAIKAAIQKTRATLRAYQSKQRNGEGNSATNANGIRKAEAEIARLEAML